MDGGCDISSMSILNECSGPLWRWHVVLLTCVVLVGDSLSGCCLHWWCCCQCLYTSSMVGVGSVCGCATSARTHPSMPIVHFLGWSSLGVLPACTIVIIIFCCSQKYLPACLQGWPHDAMKVIVVDLCCASLSRPFCCATWPPWLSDVMDKVWNVCTSCEEQWCSLFCVSALEAWIWGWNEWMNAELQWWCSGNCSLWLHGPPWPQHVWLPVMALRVWVAYIGGGLRQWHPAYLAVILEGLSGVWYVSVTWWGLCSTMFSPCGCCFAHVVNVLCGWCASGGFWLHHDCLLLIDWLIDCVCVLKCTTSRLGIATVLEVTIYV